MGEVQVQRVWAAQMCSKQSEAGSPCARFLRGVCRRLLCRCPIRASIFGDFKLRGPSGLMQANLGSVCISSKLLRLSSKACTHTHTHMAHRHHTTTKGIDRATMTDSAASTTATLQRQICTRPTQLSRLMNDSHLPGYLSFLLHLYATINYIIGMRLKFNYTKSKVR